ncbi:YwdI family protein [Planococcus sp. N028]|uniref:YwdI family protein n=1 Tax=Planococcus shixiaomingii TaxID=3058393 RepID=A0ABT8N1S2_9BACL|nr:MULTISPECIES: YwdI family protein [unclassified Planococcus (in: firmicutes)]MDN7241843.1 YwdI family protein [Planococcus sp. N028]WKA54129.1 YwdI family protein [Planococcus sp. N022]
MAVAPARILSEIEKYASKARTQDPAKMRESVVAIRTLCNLLLDEDDHGQNKTPHAVPLASPSPSPQISLAENKLKEEDANGDSLFDF